MPEGPVAPGVDSRLRTLVRFLVVAAPVAALLATLSDGLVVASAVEDASWTSMLQRGGMPWATLLAGIGVTSLARVMAHARVLQDDVDGLV